MTINVSKEKVHINKMVCTKKEIFFVEKDFIVPDAKPDVLNTIYTSGIVSLYKTEIQDERVRIDGSINSYIMYFADNKDDKIRGLNTNLDFSEIIDIPNTKEGMDYKTETKIKSIETRVINGRKIGIKATVEINIQIYSDEEIEIVKKIDDNNMQVLKNEFKLNSMIGKGETKIYSKENITLQDVDNIAEILKVGFFISNKETKISYNKVLSKAEANMKIMYLTEDNRIKTVNSNIPLVGFIDIANVSEGNICNTGYELKNILVSPNSEDEHSINIEIEVLVKCMVYEEKNIILIQDMYSPIYEISFNQKQISTMINSNFIKDIKKIREKIVFENIGTKSLIDVDIMPNYSQDREEKNLIIGELECNFTMMDSNMNLEQKRVKIPFEYKNNIIEDNYNLELEMSVINQDFVVQNGGEINCNIDLEIVGKISKNENLRVIEDITQEEKVQEQDYGVVIYIVKKGDTFWNIAKKFKTNVDDIIRVNGIQDFNKIEVGQKIYIPRFIKK